MLIVYIPKVTKIVLMKIIVWLSTVTMQGNIRLCLLYSQSLGMTVLYCLPQTYLPNTNAGVCGKLNRKPMVSINPE